MPSLPVQFAVLVGLSSCGAFRSFFMRVIILYIFWMESPKNLKLTHKENQIDSQARVVKIEEECGFLLCFRLRKVS